MTALHYGLESKLSDAPFGVVHQDFQLGFSPDFSAKPNPYII